MSVCRNLADMLLSWKGSLSSNAAMNSWLGPILSSLYCMSHKLFYCAKPNWGYFSCFVIATRARSHKSIHLKFTCVHGWAGTGEYAETLWTCHFHQNIKRCEWSQQRSRLCQVKPLLLLWFMRIFLPLVLRKCSLFCSSEVSQLWKMQSSTFIRWYLFFPPKNASAEGCSFHCSKNRFILRRYI